MEIGKELYYRPSRPKGFYLDPRTKILLLAYMSLAMMAFNGDVLVVSLLALLPFSLLIQNRQWKTALIYGGLFILGVISIVYHENWQLSSVPNALIMILIALIVRLFPALLLGYYFMKSTSVRDFIAAMNKWNVSEKFIIPISVVLRFIPTIKEESASIKMAMKMREIEFGSKRSLKNPALFFEYRVVPLLISIAKIGEELSAAALTRGLGVDKKRTTVAVISFGKYDLIMLVWAITMTIIGVYRRVML